MTTVNIGQTFGRIMSKPLKALGNDRPKDRQDGKGGRTRTRNLLGWNQTLYQLSYTPSNSA